jgi:CubicO group peptidase (beta-lactamase class C family)
MTAMDQVMAGLRALPTTGFLVLRGSETVLDYGDNTSPAYLASVRKSVLSVLFGRSVGNGSIALDATLGELGIDDVGGLLPIERQARVRDLLTARSGVYHAPSTATGLEEGAPERGSQKPGEHFFYNNWDFNVLGTIFERCTGRAVFDALAEDIAEPLGFQDFDLGRQRLLGRSDRSVHLAHHFFLSGRDLGRIGQMMLNGGRWGDRQVVPAEWVAASTTPQVGLEAGAPMGYGYLWWIPQSLPKGTFLAIGNWGQYLLGIPPNTVVVHQRAVPDDLVVARADGSAPAGPVGAVTPRQFMGLVRTALKELGG